MRSIGALADTISTGTEAMSGATNGVGTRAKSTSKGTDTFSGAARGLLDGAHDFRSRTV